MILKTIGKLFALWFAMMGLLAMAVLAIFVLALVMRFGLVAVLFAALCYCFIWALGVEVRFNPRYRHINEQDEDRYAVPIAKNQYEQQDWVSAH